VSSLRELDWQADTFAAFILMPERLVRQEWDARHSGPVIIPEEMVSLALRNGFTSRTHALQAVADEEAKPLAELFKVSRQAMQIRLYDLGLLPRPE
jgi:Zn-dependent peptidase ImmA (M78 family)